VNDMNLSLQVLEHKLSLDSWSECVEGVLIERCVSSIVVFFSFANQKQEVETTTTTTTTTNDVGGAGGVNCKCPRM